jgi:hypothetical protein
LEGTQSNCCAFEAQSAASISNGDDQGRLISQPDQVAHDGAQSVNAILRLVGTVAAEADPQLSRRVILIDRHANRDLSSMVSEEGNQ